MSDGWTDQQRRVGGRRRALLGRVKFAQRRTGVLAARTALSRMPLVAASCVVVVAALYPSTAGAGTQGFHVYNLTGSPLKVKEIRLSADNGHYPAKFDTSETAPPPPRVGDVLSPGVDVGRTYDHNHIELEQSGSSRHIARIFYGPANGRDWGATLDTSEGTLCEWFSPAPYCKTSRYEIFFLDAPGTVHELPASDPGKQAELLQNMCTDADLKEFVSCEFDPKSRDTKAFGAPHLIGGVHPNCTEHETEEEIAQDVMKGTDQSFGTKLGAETEFNVFGQKVKTSIEFEYKTKWLEEHTFSHTTTYRVDPKHVGYVIGKNPVIRVSGDLTVKIGNTTLILRDVHFDSPDPTREGQEQWTPHTPKMTAEQLKECDENGLTQASATWASAAQRGTNGPDELIGGRESDVLQGLGGDDILRAGSGNDTLFGGRGADLLLGGAGRDVLSGGPGADTIIDTRGPALVRTGADTGRGRDFVYVRDGRADDTVICGSRRSYVVVDRGDRVRGRCGVVIRRGSIDSPVLPGGWKWVL